jgi:hypothetical protein
VWPTSCSPSHARHAHSPRRAGWSGVAADVETLDLLLVPFLEVCNVHGAHALEGSGECGDRGRTVALRHRVVGHCESDDAKGGGVRVLVT